VRIRENEAADYKAINLLLARLDPTGTRPLFAFGYTGGFNYFLNRTNPTPLEEGFRISNFPADDVVKAVENLSTPPFLIDNLALRKKGMPPTSVDLSHWEPRNVTNYFERVDRPYFQTLIDVCLNRGGRQVWHEGIFTIYDCAPN
jgi:hypothetical protein